MRFPLTIATLIVALCAPLCAARTYYVAPGGSDSNTGAEDAPLQSIQSGSARAGPGDLVLVRKGEYAGFVMGWEGAHNGKPDAPITIRGEDGAIITSRNNKTLDAINLEGASYITIEGFTIHGGGTVRAGIRSARNTGVIIRNNTIDQPRVWGIFTSFSENVLIVNNSTSGAVKEHGIYVSNTCSNPIVRGNRAFDNRGNGIHFNGDISYGGKGVITNALVENNTIYGNGRGGGSGINCDGVQDSVIRNNLLYDNHASGISLYRVDAAKGAKGNKVINNTIIVAPDGRWAINIKNGSSGNQIFNNILLGGKGAINIAADSLSAFASDHNITANQFSADDGETFLTLSRWRSKTSHDQHSATSDPDHLFVNPAAGDFHLRPTAPALGAADPTKTPEKDCEGNARKGKPSAGALGTSPAPKPITNDEARMTNQ